MTSQLKSSDFLTLGIGTFSLSVAILALPYEILAPSAKILAPFGATLDENGMHMSDALSVRLYFLDLCVVSDSLYYAYHYATMSCTRRDT